MADKWGVTWEHTAHVPIGRKNIPQQRTVQLHLPDGDIAYLPRIEQMYADHQEDK
jgi:hypothetical protein